MSANTDHKKILLTGGGTGGSVSPLLAIAKELQKKSDEYEFFWVGTKGGVEQEMLSREEIEFHSIPSGKLRRYFDIRNLVDPFKIVAGFFSSLFIVLRRRPSVVVTAGSFVSVPVVWAAWLLGVPTLVHQQDVRPGLANKLMAPFATKVTVTFQRSLNDYGDKAVWTGNPAAENPERTSSARLPEATQEEYTVLIVGGGTGSLALNQLIEQSRKELLKDCRLIHITGKNKQTEKELTPEERKRYYVHQFLDHPRMLEAIYISDVVVSRAGLGFLTEISHFARPSILIPIPDSHQEDNARLFKENDAALVLDQKQLTPDQFAGKIKELLRDEKLRNRLAKNAEKMMRRDGTDNMVQIVTQFCHHKNGRV